MDLPLDEPGLRAVLRRHGMVFALIFGSHATGRAHAGSDVDLAVWPGGRFDEWRLRGELPEMVDLLDLRGTPEALAGRVAMEGRVLLDDDPPQRIRWQAQTRKRHLDEAVRREAFRRVFVRAHG